jgi:CRP/FNR family cyclic AMP-dependent transcriptional regulator
MVSPELLRRYPFFGRLSEAHLKAIAMLADEVFYSEGQTFIEIGRPADTLYLLIEGGIDLHYIIVDKDDPKRSKDFYVGDVNPGEPFGISALIEPYRYTASVRVTSPSRVLKIDGIGLRALCEVDCEITAILMRNVARSAMSRLEETRTQLIAARDQSIVT